MKDINALNNVEDKLIDLQTRIAYQEDTLTHLDHVITKQDADILQLQQQMRLLAKRLDEVLLTRDQGDDAITNERPPHY